MTPTLIFLTLFLCDSPAHAIAYETALSSGLSEPMARNAVGKAAGRDGCGPYGGDAVIVSEQTIVDRSGRVLRLTQYRFAGRRPAVAWEARVAVPADAVARGDRT